MTLSMRHGRLPAYGRQLLAMRELREVPADPVIVTDCWPIANWFRDNLDWCVLVCDPPTARFDLSVVHCLDVMAVHLGDAPPAWVDQLRAHEPRLLEICEARTFAREFVDRVCRFLDMRGGGTSVPLVVPPK